MKNSIIFLTTVILLVITLFGYNCKSPTETEPNTVTDIDGNVYKTIKIGDQIWMAENLKVTHFRNGIPIPYVTDNAEWENLETAAYCAYDNYDRNADTYGYLYNWYAVNDSCNIAPEGWHVPTENEWQELELYLGIDPSVIEDIGHRGNDEADKLKSESGWNSHGQTDGNGSNESGFTALPAGKRDDYSGIFGNLGWNTYFWSCTEQSTNRSWERQLYAFSPKISRSHLDKRFGFSVRCIKND